MADKDRKNKYKYEWTGDIAAVLGIIALLPIAWYVTSTGYVRDINIIWMLIKLAATCLWLYFGWVNKITPNIISAICIGLIMVFLIGMKLYIGNESKSIAPV